MSPLVSDLEKALRGLDAETAALLERAVRDAVALAERRGESARLTDSLGYPEGYFESTAGCFAGEPLERNDLPIQLREEW